MSTKEKERLSNKVKSDLYDSIVSHNNLCSIVDIDPIDIPDHDLFTYSFPCQDISVAGKQKGLDIHSGTRSGLLWECQKVIHNKKPKFLLLENVKNLVGKKHKHNFDLWLEYLESEGYSNYWEVLNAKDFGVPQNRERVFVVSVLNGEYTFPKPVNQNTKLLDILEENVDAKYFLSEEISKTFVRNGNSGIHIGNLELDKWQDYMKRIYSPLGLSPTLNTMQGGNRQPKVLINDTNIRRLTPLECWRLMGFSTDDFYKVKQVCSNTQLYKFAGNSIVVNVLESIFRNLFDKEG